MLKPLVSEENETFDDVDPKTPFVRNRPIRTEKMDDNLFLIDQDMGTIDMLDPLGSLIWEILAEPISVEDMAHLISEAFPATDIKQIQSDVQSLFNEFFENEWIGS